jgi:phage-related protein
MFHGIASTFDSIRHTVAHTWDVVWDNTVGRTAQAVHDVERWFISLRSWVTGFFANAGSWLYNQGRNIVTGLWNGIKAAWTDVVSWFKGMPHAILHALGIASPPPWSIDAGKHIMGGLLKGIAHGASDVKGFFVNLASNITGPLKAVWSTIGGIGHAIGGFFSKLVGAGGSGVGRWAGVVAQALAMLGLSQSLAGRVLYQMQTESGGNPNAINNWDINAQRGDPSRGLMQTIGSTFAAYHVAGTSTNIYDPLANVAAALNYARTVYGPSLMRGSMGVGSGHGYDTGGWLPPGVTLAINRTGESELVLTQDQLRGISRGGDGATIYNAHFDGLTGQAIEGHVRTAFAAMSVTQGNLNRQGRRR